MASVAWTVYTRCFSDFIHYSSKWIFVVNAGETMPNILLIEDSRLFGNIVKEGIQHRLGFKVTWAQSLKEAENLLQDVESDFFVALLDLNLPDAPDGEIVDVVLGKKIPSIVFTAEFDAAVREKIWSKKIIDYVLKQSPQEVDYIIDLVGRIHRNQSIKVLVADDSETVRKEIKSLLEVHQYQVIQACDGIEGLEAIKAESDIKIVITDYEMPRMDGFQLTQKIRALYPKEALAIIGISAQNDHVLAAKFIKSGANDFIPKPFAAEEFYCRITQNIEAIENIERLHNVEADLRQAKADAEAVNRALRQSIEHINQMTAQVEQADQAKKDGRNCIECVDLDVSNQPAQRTHGLKA